MVMATILCIDNEPLVRQDIAEDLRETGYRVLEADDGRQGLEMILYYQPDLIVCDIIMPRMDGYELFRELRERYNPQKEIPFIFLSGLNQNYQIASGLSIGAQNYLTKPVSFRLLRTTVAARLSQNLH
jgi:CheY-like chemotaxis protein